MSASPCVSVCRLDRTGHHCLGCGRTRDDIARWPAASLETRRAINLAARERLRAGRPGFFKWLFTGAQ